MVAGLLAGLVTGLLHTKLGIPAILAGILTQFALYSINLRIMSMKANTPVNPDKYDLFLTLRSVPGAIWKGLLLAAVLIALLYWYFGTEQGSAIRATGANPAMSRAQGINIDAMKVLGLSLSNGMVALSGGLMAQYQGFADINMGRGAIVIGLAAVIIGEVLCDAIFRKGCNFSVRLGFVVLGGIVYYLVMVLILWLKLDPNDLKLFTAVIVAAFLAVPYLKGQAKSSFHRREEGRQADMLDVRPYLQDLQPRHDQRKAGARRAVAAPEAGRFRDRHRRQRRRKIHHAQRRRGRLAGGRRAHHPRRRGRDRYAGVSRARSTSAACSRTP